MNKLDPICTNLNELKEAIEKLTDARKDTATKLFTEIQFLERTLVKLREDVDERGAVVRTARTVKESPAMKMYNTTIQRYSLLFKQIIDLFPPPVKEATADPLLEFAAGGLQLRLNQ